jgi:hypothetical protein
MGLPMAMEAGGRAVTMKLAQAKEALWLQMAFLAAMDTAMGMCKAG